MVAFHFVGSASALLTYTCSHTFIHYTDHSTLGPVIQRSTGAVLRVIVCVVDRVNLIIHTNSSGGNNILDFRENAINIEPSPWATDMTLFAIPFAPGCYLNLTAPWVMWVQVICTICNHVWIFLVSQGLGCPYTMFYLQYWVVTLYLKACFLLGFHNSMFYYSCCIF